MVSECAYWVFRQKDLVALLKQVQRKDYAAGREIGILAYNDTPLYEVIEQGISVISTDFYRMGSRAAHFIRYPEPIKEIIPTYYIERNSL